jgi:non-specific serine/threonine protein kinase
VFFLEVIWRSAGAYAFARDGETFTDGGLTVGEPANVIVLEHEVPARLLSVPELIALSDDPPLELGDSARVLFALVDLARRSVSEGMVHPQLTRGGDAWYAFWGATLDEHIQSSLAEIAAALPFVGTEGFHEDGEATVDNLYPQLVDQIARDKLAGVRLGSFGRGAVEAFLAGLSSPDPELPVRTGYPSLEKKLTKWVDDGFAVLKEVTWRVGLHLDDRPRGALALELWLHADDVSLPVSLLWEGGDFSFVRDGDPLSDLERDLVELRPLLAKEGIEFDDEEPFASELDAETASYFLRYLLPELEKRDVPVALPSAWLRAPTRLRANVTARNASSGLLSSSVLASFDWRLAVGDSELSDEELRALATAKAPVVQVDGQWQAVRPADVKRALRFLERRQGVGFVDLVRAVSGLDTDEYGLELGAVHLDRSLDELLSGKDARFRPRPTPKGMQHDLFPFQEKGHGWLRMLGDLGIGAILADDMGLGKTVQAIAMLVSEREEHGAEAFGPTLVVCPMSVARQWVAEIARFAPGLRVHLHHGSDRLANEELMRKARAVDVVVTSYDIASRDVDALAEVEWDRLIMDEAQDVKNPQTKRAKSLRMLSARRRVAMTGTPIENRLSELWAIMDILNPGLLGSREWFARTFGEPIEVEKDEAALERLRAVVRPFILRRSKDEPEVELDLPPITVTKEYVKLTLEQASLYQATVDSWLPRIESHEDRFGRRGAVLAMLGHLKQVCNHPEMLMHTGAPLDHRSGKLERLVELLAGMPAQDKALVFTQYPSFDRLVPHLEERLGRKVGFFHGRLNARQRDELLAEFASDAPGGPTVLVISLRAGGRGLNLPAANHVFHFDRWWNPAVEQQATDRAHRLGQHKPVFVHSLISTGTLEERIDLLLESKRELVEKVMAGRSEDWLGDLDLGAIRAAVALAPSVMDEEAA